LAEPKASPGAKHHDYRENTWIDQMWAFELVGSNCLLFVVRIKMTESAFISMKPQRKYADNPSKMAACKTCGSLFIPRSQRVL
jgi:hypothetical protein